MPTSSPGSSSFFPSRRHIEKQEDPGDEVVGYVDQDAYRVDFPEKLTKYMLKQADMAMWCSCWANNDSLARKKSCTPVDEKSSS